MITVHEDNPASSGTETEDPVAFLGTIPATPDRTVFLGTIPAPPDRTVSALYAVKYVSPRARYLTPEEAAIRATAYALKKPTSEAIAIAAPAMAALIDGPCWLVPVPASTGSLAANLALARAIAERVLSARVKCAVARAHPVTSSHCRRLRGLLGLLPAEHAIIRTAGPMGPLPLYFVDNVITSGATIAACRHALGWGTGLAYADASTRVIIHHRASSPTLS